MSEIDKGRWVLVPAEPTPEMVAAYLTANDAYWKRVDDHGPPPIGIWRDGTPSAATAESYRAMLAAAPPTPHDAWRPRYITDPDVRAALDADMAAMKADPRKAVARLQRVGILGPDGKLSPDYGGEGAHDER